MDLNTIGEVIERPHRAILADLREGDAVLGGGTWLYSEPQPHLRRLIDLTGFGWPSIETDHHGVTIGATCRIAELERWTPPPEWRPANTLDQREHDVVRKPVPTFRHHALVPQCCRALLGSFKIWNAATVGGNLCLALPAGPMTALGVALRAECLIWSATAERTLPAEDFVLGNQRNALEPGEILRAIRISADAFRPPTAFRQISLTPLGRSAALLIGILWPQDRFVLTITASTPRPLCLGFDGLPSAETLDARIAAIGHDLWFDDVHGRPDWRRRVTRHLAREILDELREETTR